METWIIYLLAPAGLALVTYILNRTQRRLDATTSLVTMLQGEIGRLTVKVEKMESKLELKDQALEQKNIIIQESYACRTPSSKCPVLIMQAGFNKQKRQFYENTTHVAMDAPADGELHTDQGVDQQPDDAEPPL